MYRFLLLIVMVSTAFQSFGEENLVVLAFPKEAKISDKSCSYYLRNKTKYCHDGVIELKYEIDEVLSGKYDNKSIKIIDFVHHSGFPAYLREFPIVLSLVRDNGYYFLVHDIKLLDLGENEGVCADKIKQNIPKSKLIKVTGDSSCEVGITLRDYKSLLAQSIK